MVLEEWEVIPDFSRYKVSNQGRVWDVKNGLEVSQVLAGIPQYKYVNMTRDDGQRKLIRVHRIIAEAFVPNPENLPIVDHINQDKMDNRISNLRWVTRSGNGRNQHNNLYVEYKGGEKLLIELVEELYGKQENQSIYQYFSGRIANKNETFEQARISYEVYKDIGQKSYTVEWDGEVVYLMHLCRYYKKDYGVIKQRLANGWSVWNAMFGISDKFYGYCLDGIWFPSLDDVAKFTNKPLATVERLIKDGASLGEICAYDIKEVTRKAIQERNRIEVLGVRGTIQELCRHFEVSYGCVGTRTSRLGWSLEKALTTPQERVRRYKINGELGSAKYWIESFGLNPKCFNSKKSSRKFTFRQTLEYYGVDTSGMEIEVGD